MNTEDLIDALATEGKLFARFAFDGSLDAPVPCCAGWDVRALVRHQGAVHRWATDIVVNQRTVRNGWSREFQPSDEVDLADWYREGLAQLIDALHAARAGVPMFGFYPAADGRTFWAGRQALETAIHRADAQATRRGHAEFSFELATEGVAELLGGFGTGERPGPVVGRLGLNATDCPAVREIVFGPEQVSAVPDRGELDARVSGTTSELFLWLWNRDAAVSVTGDQAVAAEWGRRVRI